MEYRIERYKNCLRFNEQYESIYQFLLEAEKLEYNEHFHWGPKINVLILHRLSWLLVSV